MSEESNTAVQRGIRKELVGEVVSTKMDKTIVVKAERRFAHPRYGKVVRSFKKYYAHDDKNEANIGDLVKIRECRPYSKTKRWCLVGVVKANIEAVTASKD